MEIGFDSFVSTAPDPVTGKSVPPAELINNLIDEIDLADKVGLDVVGLGEHHRAEFLDSAPAVILAAAAARTSRIRLTSAVTVLSAAVHALGYVAETDEQAANDFFPGYAREFTQIGRERGWPPVTRSQFEAVRGPTGALIVSDPKGVVEKIRHYNESLGGISRLTFQMSVAGLSHEKLAGSIELMGTMVIPKLR